MRALISKSNIYGTVKAPSSKSYTLRGLICAALAEGTSEIIDPLQADDTEAAREVLGKIGVALKAGRTPGWSPVDILSGRTPICIAVSRRARCAL